MKDNEFKRLSPRQMEGLKGGRSEAELLTIERLSSFHGVVNAMGGAAANDWIDRGVRAMETKERAKRGAAPVNPAKMRQVFRTLSNVAAQTSPDEWQEWIEGGSMPTVKLRPSEMEAVSGGLAACEPYLELLSYLPSDKA
jgi:hypothetical protein